MFSEHIMILSNVIRCFISLPIYLIGFEGILIAIRPCKVGKGWDAFELNHLSSIALFVAKYYNTVITSYGNAIGKYDIYCGCHFDHLHVYWPGKPSFVVRQFKLFISALNVLIIQNIGS